MNAERLLQHFERLSETSDAIPRLRRLILDLAVHGKLVPQDPNDEPAAELLKRIQAEKAQLIKDGTLKKSVVTSSRYNIKVPLELPETWVLVCLGDVAQYGIPEKADSNRKIEPETWVLDLEDVEKDTSRLIKRAVSSGRPFRSTKTVFRRGDVLFGKLRPYLNKVIIADMDGVCSTEIVPIRGYCDIVPEYTKLVLKSPLTMRRVDRLMYGMKMPRLGTNDATSLEFPLPPLAEQHRIVAKVNELMALCDDLEAAKTEREQSRDRLVAASLQRLNQPADDETFRVDVRFVFKHLPRLITCPAHIKQLRQTILNLAVRGKLIAQNPNDEPAVELLKRNSVWRTDAIQRKQIREPRKPLNNIDSNEFPYVLPSGWSWARLGEIIYIQSGDGLISENMKNGDIPVFGGNGINGYHDISNVNEPSIVIGRVGYYCGSIHTTPPKAWVTDNAFITQYCKDSISMRFLVLLLNRTNLKENESATAQPVISGSKIYPIVIGLPPLAEQHRIAAKVDELMALCNQLETQLSTTTTDGHRLLEAVLHEALAPALKEAA